MLRPTRRESTEGATQLADWTCPKCGWVNRDISADCLSCGRTSRGRPSDSPGGRSRAPGAHRGPRRAQDAAAPGHARPAAAVVRTDHPEPWFRRRTVLTMPGLAVSAVAAVIAPPIWYAVVAFSSYQIGFVADCGGLASDRYRCGDRRSWSRLAVAGWVASVLVTVLALGVSEYLISLSRGDADWASSSTCFNPSTSCSIVIVDYTPGRPVDTCSSGRSPSSPPATSRIKAIMTPRASCPQPPAADLGQPELGAGSSRHVGPPTIRSSRPILIASGSSSDFAASSSPINVGKRVAPSMRRPGADAIKLTGDQRGHSAGCARLEGRSGSARRGTR